MKTLMLHSIGLALSLLTTRTYAQEPVFRRLINRSSPKLAVGLNSATQAPQVGVATAATSVWRMVPVAGQPDYFQLVNNQTGQMLRLQDGNVITTAVDETEVEGMWSTTPIARTGFVHIINRDKGQRLNVSGNKLRVSDINANNATAMWKLTPARGTSSPGAPDRPVQPPIAAADRKAVNDYVQAMTYDPRRLLAVEGDGGTILQDKQTGSSTNRNLTDNAVILCTTTKYSMSNNFAEVVIMQPTNGIVYPGALVYADLSLVRGQPRPLTNLPLAPVRLTVDLPGIGDKGDFTVANPSNGSVQTALQKALTYWNDGPAYKEGYINAARSSSNAAMSYNSEQIGMSLGVNVKWASGEVGAQFAYNTTSQKSVALMMFRQVFYTVTAEPPANPADAFGKITLGQAMNTFSNETPPAYVQSVSYGRIIMFRMETSGKVDEAKMKATLKYAAGAVSTNDSASATYKSILRNSSITYALLGGNAEVESNIASAQNFNDLEPIIKGKNSVYSKSNPGVPIAYTVRFLKDHQIARMGFTTEYTKEECIRRANMFVRLQHAGGYVAKYEITYNDNGEQRKIETGDKTAGYSQTFYFPGDATNIALKGWAMTGLVWDPWGEIYNLRLQADGVNKCYKNEGTTLGRSWNNDCPTNEQAQR